MNECFFSQSTTVNIYIIDHCPVIIGRVITRPRLFRRLDLSTIVFYHIPHTNLYYVIKRLGFILVRITHLIIIFSNTPFLSFNISEIYLRGRNFGNKIWRNWREFNLADGEY